MTTVITMTSYPKRINEVAKFIYKFMTTQIYRPDYFYLWLSTIEFPNKEKDLPEELLLVCSNFNVKISWVNYNDGCMKRWNVYPTHYNDTVAAVDEDNFYDVHLVEKMKTIKNYTGEIYAIWDRLTNYLLLEKPGIDFRYRYYKILNRPSSSIEMKLAGQSVIPPKTFPLEAIKPEYVELRLKYCKKCDESWLQPFYKLNGIKSASFKLPKTDPDDSMEKTGINANGKRINNVWWKNLQMYLVLRLFPDMLKKWKTIFPKYDDSAWAKMSIDDIAKKL